MMRRALIAQILLPLLVAAACGPMRIAQPAPEPEPERPGAEPARDPGGHAIVPLPAEVRRGDGAPYTLTAGAPIRIDPSSPEVVAIAEQLAAILRPSTGFELPIATAQAAAATGAITLRLEADAALGEEGYRLDSSAGGLTLSAGAPAGLFRGIQTIRQLLPPQIEAELTAPLRNQTLTVPPLSIVDRPRFSWRGSMLDVARHFLTVEEVKQYIDGMALYKMNVLHLHLSDDQGWRIEIRARPRLTEVGGRTQVGGGPGGFYSQEEYAEIVRYAAERYITVVPEIDMPGHTNAALVAYPELSCGTRPPMLYTGTEVGFSTFCVDDEETYRLVGDILRELAAITPGPFLHIGGDEVEALTDEQYARFIERVQEIVTGTGKRMIGWEEIAKGRLLPTSVAQMWRSQNSAPALRHGAKLVLSPSSRAYIDMKYDRETELGLTWAGLTEVRHAYDWDPATFMPPASEADILGVEAPLWGETYRNITSVQYLAFPRLPAIAEIGWTPQPLREWDSFRRRIAAHAPRWNILGINYHRSPQVW